MTNSKSLNEIQNNTNFYNLDFTNINRLIIFSHDCLFQDYNQLQHWKYLFITKILFIYKIIVNTYIFTIYVNLLPLSGLFEVFKYYTFRTAISIKRIVTVIIL